MRIYNTYSRAMEPFVPREGNIVKMYTCGPTVYNYAHIGNFRAYVFEDVLRRQLNYAGFDVTQVMNLTDVDDKTIAGAQASGKALSDYTKPYIDAFFADLAALHIERAEHYPAATDHIPEVIALIERLIERGHAYVSDDGAVYYRVASFSDYGRLAHLDLEGLQAGARIASDEYEKDNVSDFALWKAWDEADGDVRWDSPWGPGRPGWHIECSAMSTALLGDSFDLHTGGIDNMFPHHENEIAQSEGATGVPFVKYWMHCGYLIVDGKKMSKSLGNFYTLRDLIERGYTGREVRYVLLSAQYRQPLNFTFAGLDAARTALTRVDEFAARLEAQAAGALADGDVEWAVARRDQFRGAMADDLNTPEALAGLFDFIHDGNRALDGGDVTPGQAAAALAMLHDMDRIFDFLSWEQDGPGADVERLVALRAEARAGKDWAESDRIRDELAAMGWVVKDTPQGARLSRSGG